MIKHLKRLYSNEDGATMVEYAIMVGFIAAVCIAVVGTIGTKVNNCFTNANAF